MIWEKQGLIFETAGEFPWSRSHAQVPVVDMLNDKVWRIYYSTRNEANQSNVSYLEVEAGNPSKILYRHSETLFELGKPGTFDDAGIMPSCIVNKGATKYLYYIGWNAGVNIGYRLSIGLAISEDAGRTFTKFSEGPIMDRSIYDPCLCASPYVLVEDGVWKMWYISGTSWQVINGKAEPFYHVKYAWSNDGLEWERDGLVCIDYDEFTHGISRPCIIKENGLYKMFYSFRNNVNYRSDVNASYRIGYAESTDGLDWTRKDEATGIDRSPAGWDSEMMAYPYVVIHQNKRYLFYNGNGFGKSGFGYAVQ